MNSVFRQHQLLHCQTIAVPNTRCGHPQGSKLGKHVFFADVPYGQSLRRRNSAQFLWEKEWWALPHLISRSERSETAKTRCT